MNLHRDISSDVARGPVSFLSAFFDGDSDDDDDNDDVDVNA